MPAMCNVKILHEMQALSSNIILEEHELKDRSGRGGALWRGDDTLHDRAG